MKLLGAIVATAALTLLLLPAESQGSPSSCPDETLCVWAKTDYRGQRVKITKINHVSNKLANEMNNEASSLKNKITRTGQLYDKRDGGAGEVYGFCDDENVSDLGSFNGLASSSIVGSEMMRSKRICRARAGNTNKACPADALCVWARPGYKGKRVVVKQVGEVSNEVFDKMNDKASSVKNRWQYTSYLYSDVNGAGASRCVSGGGGKVRNLAGGYDFDNVVSSTMLSDKPVPCV